MLSPISATRGEPDLFQVAFYWLIGELSLVAIRLTSTYVYNSTYVYTFEALCRM